MTEFVRFPQTPHLEGPAGSEIRRDKIMSPHAAEALLNNVVVVEEKVDGENLGMSVDSGRLRPQARGSYVEPGGAHFRGLASWLLPRTDRLRTALGADLVLFGEWCADAHTVRYDALPDWLLVFDIFDRSAAAFWSTPRRDAFAAKLGLCVVPRLAEGRLSLRDLRGLLGVSRLGTEQMEGVVVRHESATLLLERAKLVRPDFVQQIEGHWRSRSRVPNRLNVR